MRYFNGTPQILGSFLVAASGKHYHKLIYQPHGIKLVRRACTPKPQGQVAQRPELFGHAAHSAAPARRHEQK
jgi:hypothetical protein